MCTERNDRVTSSPAAPRESDARPSYEPPSIAWEEPFEATVAATCALVSGTGDECTAVPVV